MSLSVGKGGWFIQGHHSTSEIASQERSFFIIVLLTDNIEIGSKTV